VQKIILDRQFITQQISNLFWRMYDLFAYYCYHTEVGAEWGKGARAILFADFKSREDVPF